MFLKGFAFGIDGFNFISPALQKSQISKSQRAVSDIDLLISSETGNACEHN
jgi:hypothetical protein